MLKVLRASVDDVGGQVRVVPLAQGSPRQPLYDAVASMTSRWFEVTRYTFYPTRNLFTTLRTAVRL